jgi:hypothetical protein
LAGCKINQNSSKFNILKSKWKKDYPHIEDDLNDDFKAIQEDIKAKSWRLKREGNCPSHYQRKRRSISCSMR